MKKTYIYVLKCPTTKEVRYVGKANDPKLRYGNHINKSRDKNTHKRNWINKLREAGLKPILEIIATVSIDEWKYWEKFYIEKYIKNGCDLVNCTDGGDGLTFGNKTSFKKGHGAIPIIALNLNGIFVSEYPSIKDAEIALNIKSIWHCLNGEQKTSGGFIWLYKEKYIKITSDELNDLVINANINMSGKIDNDGRFKKGNISINKGRHYRVSNSSKNIKAIYQIDKDTDEIINEFSRISDAEKIFGNGGIGNCLRGKSKTAYGYKWKYKDE